MQTFLSSPTYLIYFDSINDLYADFDTFIKKIRAIVYYVKYNKNNKVFIIVNGKIKGYLIKTNAKFIIFLNRLFTDLKKKYWLTELKIIKFI